MGPCPGGGLGPSLSGAVMAWTYTAGEKRDRVSRVGREPCAEETVMPSAKRVLLVDDSIVRGTTSKQLVKLVRDAGAREIHFRVTSPPIKYPCHYGMDFPKPDELIANCCGGDVEKIRQDLGVDSLGYLSLEKLLESVPHGRGEGYCTACFNGEYPTSIDTGVSKNEHEL